jgi:hypothetical protein
VARSRSRRARLAEAEESPDRTAPSLRKQDPTGGAMKKHKVLGLRAAVVAGYGIALRARLDITSNQHTAVKGVLVMDCRGMTSPHTGVPPQPSPCTQKLGIEATGDARFGGNMQFLGLGIFALMPTSGSTNIVCTRLNLESTCSSYTPLYLVGLPVQDSYSVV